MVSRRFRSPLVPQEIAAVNTLLAVLLAASVLFVIAPAGAAEGTGNDAAPRRFLIERTFPAGALDGLDAAGKAKVNANNASLGVRWVHSYATLDRTRTYCIYEGPSEQAVRAAAAKNGIPVDRVVEVPVDLLPH
jgi:hypothetical protein